MPVMPVISFNILQATDGDYFNHSDATTPFLLSEPSKLTINTGNTSDVKIFYISHNHDDEITDVGFYLSPTLAATRATVSSSNSETYDITSGTNDLLILGIDNRTYDYDITLPSGTTVTANQICDTINNTIGEKIAIYDNGHVLLQSPSKGAASKIYIRTTSTCLTVLGLPSDDTNPVATGSSGNWGQFGNGCYGKCVGSAVSYPFDITTSNNSFMLSLNYDNYVQVVLNTATISDDSTFNTAISSALTSAGFTVGTDIESSVSGGILTIKSLSTEDNTSVRVRPADSNDATALIGMSNPTETGTDYANSSNTDDYNELLEWGDLGYGLEISGDGTTWYRFTTTTGQNNSNPIQLTWGDGSDTSSIAKFDFIGGDTSGEIPLYVRLSVPEDELETGYREASVSVQFTYV